jgi:hypothetical protein
VGKWESRGVCGISKRGGKVGFFDFSIPRLFHSPVAPAIFSAACHRVILFAFAREMTSCTFIARSIAVFD